MGLKTTNYTVPEINITIPTAYAQITYLDININGEAHAIFDVQQTRDDIKENKSLESFDLFTTIDKSLPVYEQLYTKAKEYKFIDWEDDIV